jgi:hypothetical protein
MMEMEIIKSLTEYCLVDSLLDTESDSSDVSDLDTVEVSAIEQFYAEGCKHSQSTAKTGEETVFDLEENRRESRDWFQELSHTFERHCTHGKVTHPKTSVRFCLDHQNEYYCYAASNSAECWYDSDDLEQFKSGAENDAKNLLQGSHRPFSFFFSTNKQNTENSLEILSKLYASCFSAGSLENKLNTIQDFDFQDKLRRHYCQTRNVLGLEA